MADRFRCMVAWPGKTWLCFSQPSLALIAAFALVTPLTGYPQAGSESDTSNAGSEPRIRRLPDALDTGEEWDIGMPERPDDPFEAAIRNGRALDSEAYRALDGALRQVLSALSDQPEDKQARRQLAELRRALATRARSNMNLGYLYAARVYIALLEKAKAAPEEVEDHLQRLALLRQSSGRP